MDTSVVDKGAGSEDTSQLNRNRSFKSKQLVRSQAIRESQSPPRTISPAVVHDSETASDSNTVTDNDNCNSTVITSNSSSVINNVTNNSETRTLNDKTSDTSSHSDRCSDGVSFSSNSDFSDCKKKQPVEIQITSGSWDLESQTDQRQRTKRWLGHKNHSDSSRDLLSNNPRVACVCGSCTACPHCRGRRRRHTCPTKQDSGIVCSDDCPDCSDSEQGSNNEGIRKSGSLDMEDASYCRCPERKDRPKNISLCRTDSDEKSEPTGVDLVNFIKETLNKNPKDRMTLLRIEKELHSLVNDTGRCIVRFPVMTSYGRMLVHRCAALFQLSHHLDQTNKTSVLVSKSGTSGGRLPCTSFKQWCTANFPPSPLRHQTDGTHAKSILKRDTHSFDEPSLGPLPCNRSKSLEQRERDYERVRRRIFSTDNCPHDESQWPWNSGPIKLLTPDAGRNKLLKVQSLESSGPSGQSWRCRGAVSKSHSFSGGAPECHRPRLLSRQGDLASSSWRLSPSSSGYKTLSLRSTDSVTPSPTGGASPEPGTSVCTEGVVWAVTDLSAVPPGAVVIHPQTGRPLTNPDGTIYHFDPANPPILYDPNAYGHDEIKVESEKRRGRLEKQHSFIDNDCDCSPTEECRGKCCCECRRHDGCQQRNTVDKETNNKNDIVSNQQETINHNPPCEAPANQKPAGNQRTFEPTNQRQTYENQNCPRAEGQKSLESNRVPEPTSQRAPSDIRPPKLTNQDSQDLQQYPQQYAQGYRTDEVTSPQTSNHFIQQDMSTIQNMMALAKVTPVPMAEPMRPMSLTNMVYPAPMPQGYSYLNQCRVEPPLQPTMYQPMVHANEDQKHLPSSPSTNDNTFRIDPSYPYAAVDYASACGACVDTTNMQHRSYNVPYGQVEIPPAVLPPAYPVGNVILPQPHLQPYPYQEAVQWQAMQPGVPAPKLLVPDMYPLMQYPTYPQYNIMYPQMIPQPYPICQPIYPVIEKQPEATRRNSVTRKQSIPSCRTTPLNTPPDDKVPYDNRPKSEIAVKIQQIKDQMAQMNSKDNDGRNWQRRNSGSGILGSYPVNNFNGRAGRPVNDESQLSNEARVIVNSIRSMQAKNTYQPDTRRNHDNQYREHRQEYRNRYRQERDDKGQIQSEDPRQGDVTRNRNVNSVPVFRPPYLFRQMSPNTWCRRSPGPVHTVINPPRRPHPDTRNPGRR